MNVVKDGENRELHYHYYNTSVETSIPTSVHQRVWTGGVGIYIIAAVNYFPQAEGEAERRVFDWAVYIGASILGSIRMESGAQWAAERGEKIGLEYAKHWFPYLPEDRYRR